MAKIGVIWSISAMQRLKFVNSDSTASVLVEYWLNRVLGIERPNSDRILGKSHKRTQKVRVQRDKTKMERPKSWLESQFWAKKVKE